MRKCGCQLNADAHCPDCMKTMAQFAVGLVKLNAKYAVQVQRLCERAGINQKCRPCQDKYADWVLARLLSDYFPQIPPAMWPSQFESSVECAKILGAKKWPLMEKAYRDLCKKEGVAP